MLYIVLFITYITHEKCEKYQTLSILTHMSKILTTNVLGRIEKQIDENPADDRFGFWKNRGTREAILCLRNFVEKSFKFNKKIIYCLCRLTESFRHSKLWRNDENTKDDETRLQRQNNYYRFIQTSNDIYRNKRK